MSSSCDFHIVLYRYSCIRCHFHTPVRLCCYESSMRPYKVFLAASLPTLIAALIRRLIVGQLAWSLYCSSMSSCDFHVVLYLYSGIWCHFHTPVGLCCYESSMRPYKVFLAASLPTLIAALIRRLIVGQLAWSLYCSSMSSCDFHVVLYLYSGIWCHFHTPVGLCCYESSMRPYKVFLSASLPTLIAASCQLYSRHYCLLDSSSHRTTCGITADLSDLYTAHRWAVATSISSYIFIVASDATSTLLWDYAAMKAAVWDHTRSFLWHHCILWLRHHANFTYGPTRFAALQDDWRHHCRLAIHTPVGLRFLWIMLGEHCLYIITTWHS
jgi:hypothetical protein